MLDEMHITKNGSIEITNKGIFIKDFDGECESCRELAVLALLYGIGELQRELTELLKVPSGSGKVVLD